MFHFTTLHALAISQKLKDILGEVEKKTLLYTSPQIFL